MCAKKMDYLEIKVKIFLYSSHRSMSIKQTLPYPAKTLVPSVRGKVELQILV